MDDDWLLLLQSPVSELAFSFRGWILSPIATPKPLGSTQNVQLFKSSNLPPLSSIFTSPQVNPRKESKSTIRDVKLSQEELNPNCQRNQMGTFSCIELSGSAALASENCSPSEDATNWPSKWLQSTLFGSETLGDAKKQDTDDKTNHTADVEQENELAKQDRNDLAPCSLNHLITHCGTGNSVISISDLALEAQQRSWKLRGDNIISSTSILAVDQGNLEDSRREHFVEPFGSYIQSAADDTHVYCADAAAGVATNHDQEMLPAVIQNQLVSNDYNFYTFKVSIDGTAISQQQCGMHRRNLFNDKVGPSNKRVQNISNIHHANTCGNNYLKPVKPGIGLHLNTVALNLSNMPLTINPPLLPEQTSPATVISGSETAFMAVSRYLFVQGFKTTDFLVIVHVSLLKSIVQNSAHVKAVPIIICMRKQFLIFASRLNLVNPLAFAPTVTFTCGPVSEFGSGVGCSISCRCESCKNSFGKREGVLLLTTEKLKKGGKAKGSHGKEEKLAFDKHHVISQSGDLAASENLLATPSLEPYSLADPFGYPGSWKMILPAFVLTKS
ncbi:unnamed protein product [Miscanthus lutarioriparius]|uniref:Uncharacterized protein n=1 Tax=Miscanthus lutarioriparius TaxID=422564 RepID=A0A811MEG8_9POAL|nr:unnamed protein product [Miscanthus lutarioriparius]